MLKLFGIIGTCCGLWWLAFVFPAFAAFLVIVCLLVIAFRNRIVDNFVYDVFKDTSE
jgi:hypothetical protein